MISGQPFRGNWKNLACLRNFRFARRPILFMNSGFGHPGNKLKQ
jgi:hypothetical protein